MNWKRALALSVGAYVVSFILGLVLSIVFNVEAGTDTISTSLWIISIILTVLLSVIFTYIYLSKTKKSWKEGLYFGLVMLLVSTVLEVGFIVPYILSTGDNAILSYYADPFFWLSVALLLVSAAAVGHYRSKK